MARTIFGAEGRCNLLQGVCRSLFIGSKKLKAKIGHHDFGDMGLVSGHIGWIRRRVVVADARMTASRCFQVMGYRGFHYAASSLPKWARTSARATLTAGASSPRRGTPSPELRCATTRLPGVLSSRSRVTSGLE